MSAGWGLAETDEPPRPGTTVEDLAPLKTPFRPHGRVTAGNSAGLNDGATACLLASAEAAAELGLPTRMRLVGYAFAGVEPEVMGEIRSCAGDWCRVRVSGVTGWIERTGMWGVYKSEPIN